jgi:hypothetical protein
VYLGIGALLALLLLVAVVIAVLYARYYTKRVRIYRTLAERRKPVIEKFASLVTGSPSVNGLADAFRKHFLTRFDNFLPVEVLKQLQEECLANQARAERTFLPVHKKGGTLSYEALHYHAPMGLSVFHSEALHRWVSEVVGLDVVPTADHDQSACSVLYYDQPGDHINWHFDHNFYKGRHFTVLLSVVNRSASGGVSASQLQIKDAAGRVSVVDSSENSLVVFEGARVLHRASPTEGGDRRIILSMTFCTDPRVGLFSELCRRVKDTAYYGPRALWD